MPGSDVNLGFREGFLGWHSVADSFRLCFSASGFCVCIGDDINICFPGNGHAPHPSRQRQCP